MKSTAPKIQELRNSTQVKYDQTFHNVQAKILHRYNRRIERQDDNYI